MKKYIVTTVRCGFVSVEAQNEDEAMDIVENMSTGEIYWQDDWDISDCSEDD